MFLAFSRSRLLVSASLIFESVALVLLSLGSGGVTALLMTLLDGVQSGISDVAPGTKVMRLACLGDSPGFDLTFLIASLSISILLLLLSALLQ